MYHVMAMNAETIGLLVAGWGAVTGTVAIAIQLTQYFTDRSKLKLHAFMSMASNEKMLEHHLVFTIEVVNHGRRVSYIRRAGIQLEPSVMHIGGKWTQADESELTIFDADRTGRTIELAEGKRHLFVLEPFREKIGDTFRDTEVAFVIDSRGRKQTTKFQTIKSKDLPKKRIASL
jgi:hypothetical protein